MNQSSSGHGAALNLTRLGSVALILVFLAIDFLFFHDLFEPKTVPEYLTGAASVPVVILSLLLVVGVIRFEAVHR